MPTTHGIQISEQWARLLTPGLRKVWNTRLDGWKDSLIGDQFFTTDTSGRSYEEHQAVGNVPDSGWNQFETAGRVNYVGMKPGYVATFTHHEYAQGLQIERKLIDDNLYPGAGLPRSITQRVEGLADSAVIKREKSKANVFINGFTDSGTDVEGFPIAGQDSVGLLSTAHVFETGGAQQANEGTFALTAANVEATITAMRGWVDDVGEVNVVSPDVLLVPPELEFDALRIVGSELDPASANNAQNPLKGRLRVVVWDYLTDANAWFLIDSRLAKQHLVWYDRVPLEFAAQEDFDTLIGKWRAYMRYSRGFDDWRWIYGQNPS